MFLTLLIVSFRVVIGDVIRINGPCLDSRTNDVAHCSTTGYCASGDPYYGVKMDAVARMRCPGFTVENGVDTDWKRDADGSCLSKELQIPIWCLSMPIFTSD